MSWWRSILAVGAGVLTTTVLGVLLAALLGVLAWSIGNATPANTGQLLLSPLVMAASIGIGLVAMTLGGYQAGKVAGHAEVVHAGVVGVVVMLASLAMALLSGGPNPYPLWYTIVSNGITLPAALAGGVLARWRFGSPAHAAE